jgi:hypothetical protein
MKPARRAPPIAETLADQIGALRHAGMSDRAIAEAAGIDRMTVWRYRNGYAEAPRYRNVQAVGRLHRAKLGDRSE